MSFSLADNVDDANAQYSEVYCSSEHRDHGLRYALMENGLKYHCGFDPDCVTQPFFKSSQPDSCTPNAVCNPAHVAGFTLRSGFSYLPSGDFLFHTGKMSGHNFTKDRWNIREFWKPNATLSAHIPGHFT